MLNGIFKVANKVFPARVAYAHCDIPCGIYDPHLAQLAALSVIRMNQLIDALAVPPANPSPKDRQVYLNSISRYIAVKEHHAELCKQELRILWGDYFKPEHLQKYPELHTQFWNAMKLASKVRQEVNMDAAQQLLVAVQRIAEIFWETKGANPIRKPSLQPAGGEIVRPG